LLDLISKLLSLSYITEVQGLAMARVVNLLFLLHKITQDMIMKYMNARLLHASDIQQSLIPLMSSINLMS